MQVVLTTMAHLIVECIFAISSFGPGQTHYFYLTHIHLATSLHIQPSFPFLLLQQLETVT